jgi:hypothetical protein
MRMDLCGLTHGSYNCGACPSKYPTSNDPLPDDVRGRFSQMRYVMTGNLFHIEWCSALLHEELIAVNESYTNCDM